VPTVTFLGPFAIRRSPCGRAEDFGRMKPRQITQAWLDQWRRRLPNSHWRIEGDEPKPEPKGDSGTPESSWTRKKIITWLEDYDSSPGRYATKTQLLDIADALLNPDRVEEVQDLVEETPEIESEEPEDEGNIDEAPALGKDADLIGE
jgi:hypothetical protein